MPVRGRPGGRLIFLSVDFIVFVCNNFFAVFAYNNCKEMPLEKSSGCSNTHREPFLEDLGAPEVKAVVPPSARTRFMFLRKRIQPRVIRLCDQPTELELSLPAQVDMSFAICPPAGQTPAGGSTHSDREKLPSHRI
jgi:hypothetical protein